MVTNAIRELLNNAGITPNGPNPWDIEVRDERFYSRVWRQGILGFGESYMDEWWHCERLDEAVCRLICSGAEEKVSKGLRCALRIVPWLLCNLQSRARAYMVAQKHYDLGNDLFFSFLDPYRQYSCAYFADTDDLAYAQQQKLALIAGKLNLSANDRLLDIGCGWGGLARYAAEQHGCAVSAVNISKEQLRFAREFCKDLPVSFQECDYRTLNGRFDKIVSVGMFEHVGWKNYRTFFEVVHRCLEDDGIFLLHTIGTNATGCGASDPWILKYVFPNSMLPSVAQIAKASEGLFLMEDWHNMAPHYDKTLMAWNAAFQDAWPKLSRSYDKRFKRLWEYYLLSCAGAFRARSLQIWQIVMTRLNSGTPQPRCREVLREARQAGTGPVDRAARFPGLAIEMSL